MAVINPYLLTDIGRFRYFAGATDWKAVTRDRTYEDGGKAFNRLSDKAPKKFELVYNFNLHLEGKASDLLLFDKHFEYYQYSAPFDLLTREGVTLPNVYYSEYEPSHPGHEQWKQQRRIVLIKYDYLPVFSLTVPTTPSGVAAIPYTASPTDAIFVSWNASVPFAGRSIAHYRIKLNGFVIPDIVTGLSRAIGSLAADTYYTVAVAAVDNTGEMGGFSASATVRTNAVAVTPNAQPPAPTNPQTNQQTANSPASFGFTSAVGYVLADHEYSVSSGAVGTFAAVTTNPIGLGNAAYAVGQIVVRVKAATNRNAGYPLSNAVAFTASGGGDTTAPTVPVMSAASSITSSSIVWNWSAAYDLVGVTNYDLQIATDSAFTANLRTIALGNVLTYNDQSRAASTQYYAHVRAKDAAVNWSGYSATVKATTLAATSSLTNYALASNGGAASSAQSYDPVSFPVSAGINGVRAFTSDSEHWAAANLSTTPAYYNVVLQQARAISEFDVITVMSLSNSTVEPVADTTVSTEGYITAYEVEYRNPSGIWTNAGVSVTGNNKAWRSHTLSAAITATEFRLKITGATDNYGRLVEFEIWGTPAVPPPPAPTSPQTNDSADTFGFTLATGYPSLSDYEYSVSSGAAGTFAPVTTNPIGVGNANYAVGQIVVRVKAATGRPAGYPLSNATAFTVTVTPPPPTASNKYLYDDASGKYIYDDTTGKRVFDA